MSERTFKRYLVLLAVFLVLSAMTFPGAMFGFLLGVTIAFFVAGPTLLATAALQNAGLPITDRAIPGLLVALYAMFTLASMWRAWRAWHRESADAARLASFRAVLMAAFPLAAWLWSQALVRAWP